MAKLTRREFVRISALTGAATVVSACGAAPASPAAPSSGEPAAPAVQPTAAPSAAPTAAPAAEGQPRFREAPMLAELVAQGQLPPVDERIPQSPCICPVMEGIGNYGGTMRRGFTGMSDRNGPSKTIAEGMTSYNSDLSVRANILESWETNEDASVWTITLRPGLKWSDGSPFTAADILWYQDHQVKNSDLTKSPSDNWSTGSPKVAPEVEAPDDFTVIVRFAHPKPLWAFVMTRFVPATPGAFMERYHPDFVDKADLEKAAKDAGMETWMDWFNDRNAWYNNIERPNLGPWIPKNELSNELFMMERNPYFWQTDAEGQQLPYIDRITHRMYESPDVFNMWIVNGEIDFQNRGVGISNYTLYKESEEKSGYKVFLGISASHTCLQLNHTTKNPRLREFFGKREVRLAMSYAVNREELNEIVYDGMATPRQYSPLEQSPQYYEKLSNAHTAYDPEKANQLLDEAGYAAKGPDGIRLWDDGSGEQISFMFEGTSPSGDPGEDAAQMVAKYLSEIGIKAAYKYFERSLYTEHYEANEIEGAWWGGDRTVLPIVAPWIFTGTCVDRPWACAWGLWKNSNGTNPNGEEPPEGHWIWDIWKNWEEMLLEPDEDKRNDLFRGILEVWAEELPQIGYLGQFPAPIIVKNGLKGYLEGYPIDDTTEDEHLLHTQTYYWDEPDKHS